MSASSSSPKGRRVRAAGAPILVLALLTGGGAAACTGDHVVTPGATAAAVAAPTEHAVPAGHVTMPTGHEIQATWDARPAYVHAAHPDTQDAYAYALARPDVLQWLPCYCGCAGMGHGNNLDCFFKPREAGTPIVYEEHASYCDVCVKTAIMARSMLRDGRSMTEIREAVDTTFGGLAPGTPTELPPA